MKSNILKTFLLLILIVTSANAQNKPFTDEETINRLKANLTFLADDALEGRNAGSRGEKIAALFIASELQKYNVQPLGDNGTYFQSFDMKVRRYVDEPKLVLLDQDGNTIDELKPGPDFVIDDSKIFDSKFMKKNAEVVFVGYGITAEEYDYDDYENLDVNGKIVVYLGGEPASNDTNYFAGDKPTKYSSGAFKAKLASDKGAVGLIVIMPDYYIGVWPIFKSLMMVGDFKFMNEEHSAPGGTPYAMLTLDGAKKLFKNADVTYEELLNIRNNGAESKSGNLNIQTGFFYDIVERVEQIRNVVGVIEGSDPQLKNEYVLLTAHYDHVGIYDGDVCNGANDNGSGTVAMMEIAKRFAEQKDNKRSVIVALLTAEEKGLLGAHYFARNFPQIENVVADINIDMCSRGEEDVMYIIGADRTSSEFKTIMEAANAETANFKLDASLSFTRTFEMSDHYAFALKHIPACFLFDDFRDGLHGPKDELQYVDYNKIVKNIKFAERAAEKIANLDHRMVFDGEVEAH